MISSSGLPGPAQDVRKSQCKLLWVVIGGVRRGLGQAPVAWMIYPINGLLQWPVGGRRGQLQAPVASMIYPVNGVSSTGSVVSAGLAPVAFQVRRKLSNVPFHVLHLQWLVRSIEGYRSKVVCFWSSIVSYLLL